MAKKKKTSLCNGNGKSVEELVANTKEAAERIEKEMEIEDDAKYIRIPGKVVKAGKIVGGVVLGAGALAGAFFLGKRNDDEWDEDSSCEEDYLEMLDSSVDTEADPE